MLPIHDIKNYFLNLQENIFGALCAEDQEALVIKDAWTREQGGGGLTCILRDGKYIEQAAVNFSFVNGKTLPGSASNLRPDLAEKPFTACGVSLIVHPKNPYAPTMHANVRFFLTEKDGQKQWWFGGGFDLTPYYGFTEDCKFWHLNAKAACDPFGLDVYPRYKKWCDEYFYIKHRQEPRGIGGLFFDDLNTWDFDTCFAFCKSVGDHVSLGYIPILQKRKDTPYGERERNFQCYRRGRYVEFNLVYDRGTLFGLQSLGRTESILASIPPEVHWRYNWQPEPNSTEADFYKTFLVAKDWLND